MNQYFYESRSREKIKGLMEEGMMSQSLLRSKTATSGVRRQLPRLAILILGILGILEVLVR